jgi:hypothetical protein
VLARSSALLGRTVRETKFRKRFDAAIIALHRAGQRQRARIGDITLAARCRALCLFFVKGSVHASSSFLPKRIRLPTSSLTYKRLKRHLWSV